MYPSSPTSRLGSCYDSDDSSSLSALRLFRLYYLTPYLISVVLLASSGCASLVLFVSLFALLCSSSFVFALLRFSYRFCLYPTTLIARVRTTVLRYFFCAKPISLITRAAVVSRNTSGDNATDSIPSILLSTDNSCLCLVLFGFLVCRFSFHRLRKRFFHVYAFQEISRKLFSDKLLFR